MRLIIKSEIEDAVCNIGADNIDLDTLLDRYHQNLAESLYLYIHMLDKKRVIDYDNAMDKAITMKLKSLK